MEIEDRLKSLRADIAQKQSAKTRASVELEAATTQYDSAMSTLSKDFGVESVDDARSKLSELRSALDAEIESLETQLQNAGA